MAIGERIARARRDAGWSQAKLADAVGQAQTTISSWERGRTEPTREDVQRIAEALRVEVAQLELDEVRGVEENVVPFVHRSAVAPMGEPVDLAALRAHIQQIVDGTKQAGAASRMKPITREIPVVGEVAAGVWKEAAVRILDDVDEFLAMDVQGYERASLRAMKVVGPSVNLVYPEGRYVIVAHPAEAGLRSGDFVVVERHQADLVELTLKQFVVEETGRAALWPRSSDPRYQEPIFLKAKIDEDDDRQVGAQIVGVVVADYGRRERPPIFIKAT